ncbi:Uncharacterised protein [Candidatus Norongarragalina meridionalis]|nr:Uncharacterised protein [Candidatus Norongarragalina meridionalis]
MRNSVLMIVALLCALPAFSFAANSVTTISNVIDISYTGTKPLTANYPGLETLTAGITDSENSLILFQKFTLSSSGSPTDASGTVTLTGHYLDIDVKTIDMRQLQNKLGNSDPKEKITPKSFSISGVKAVAFINNGFSGYATRDERDSPREAVFAVVAKAGTDFGTRKREVKFASGTDYYDYVSRGLPTIEVISNTCPPSSGKSTNDPVKSCKSGSASTAFALSTDTISSENTNLKVTVTGLRSAEYVSYPKGSTVVIRLKYEGGGFGNCDSNLFMSALASGGAASACALQIAGGSGSNIAIPDGFSGKIMAGGKCTATAVTSLTNLKTAINNYAESNAIDESAVVASKFATDLNSEFKLHSHDYEDTKPVSTNTEASPIVGPCSSKRVSLTPQTYVVITKNMPAPVKGAGVPSYSVEFTAANLKSWLKKPGTYSIEVDVDGKYLGYKPFYVSIADPAGAVSAALSSAKVSGQLAVYYLSPIGKTYATAAYGNVKLDKAASSNDGKYDLFVGGKQMPPYPSPLLAGLVSVGSVVQAAVQSDNCNSPLLACKCNGKPGCADVLIAPKTA